MGRLLEAIATGKMKKVAELFNAADASPRRKASKPYDPTTELNTPINTLGITPLMFAAGQKSKDTLDIILYLLKQGALPSAQDFEGNTLAHILLKNGQYQAFLCLLETVPKCCMIANAQGHLPLKLAQLCQQSEAMKYNAHLQESIRQLNSLHNPEGLNRTDSARNTRLTKARSDEQTSQTIKRESSRKATTLRSSRAKSSDSSKKVKRRVKVSKHSFKQLMRHNQQFNELFSQSDFLSYAVVMPFADKLDAHELLRYFNGNPTTVGINKTAQVESIDIQQMRNIAGVVPLLLDPTEFVEKLAYQYASLPIFKRPACLFFIKELVLADVDGIYVNKPRFANACKSLWELACENDDNANHLYAIFNRIYQTRKHRVHKLQKYSSINLIDIIDKYSDNAESSLSSEMSKLSLRSAETSCMATSEEDSSSPIILYEDELSSETSLHAFLTKKVSPEQLVSLLETLFKLGYASLTDPFLKVEKSPFITKLCTTLTNKIMLDYLHAANKTEKAEVLIYYAKVIKGLEQKKHAHILFSFILAFSNILDTKALKTLDLNSSIIDLYEGWLSLSAPSKNFALFRGYLQTAEEPIPIPQFLFKDLVNMKSAAMSCIPKAAGLGKMIGHLQAKRDSYSGAGLLTSLKSNGQAAILLEQLQAACVTPMGLMTTLIRKNKESVTASSKDPTQGRPRASTLNEITPVGYSPRFDDTEPRKRSMTHLFQRRSLRNLGGEDHEAMSSRDAAEEGAVNSAASSPRLSGRSPKRIPNFFK